MRFNRPAFFVDLIIPFWLYPWVRWCYQHPSYIQLGPLASQCSKVYNRVIIWDPY